MFLAEERIRREKQPNKSDRNRVLDKPRAAPKLCYHLRGKTRRPSCPEPVLRIPDRKAQTVHI